MTFDLSLLDDASFSDLMKIPIFQSLGVSTTLLLAGLILLIILKRYAATQSKLQPARIFINRLLQPAFYLLVTLVVKSGLAIEDYYLPEPWNERLEHALDIATIALVGWFFSRCLTAAKVAILRRYNKNDSNNLHARMVHTQVGVTTKVLSFILIVVTLAGILLTFEGAAVLGESLLASAGVAGIILGFAAQKTIGNLFSGIQIAISQPIRIEDAVVVENEWGWIEEINLTYVVIRIWDLRRLVVPISYFTEKPFQNWTRNDAEIIGTVVISTDYKVPVDAMRAELDRILDSTPLWNGNVKVLQVIDTTERTVTLRALMTGKDSPTTWDLRCYAREKLINWLQTNYPDSLPRTRIMLDGEHASLQQI